MCCRVKEGVHNGLEKGIVRMRGRQREKGTDVKVQRVCTVLTRVYVTSMWQQSVPAGILCFPAPAVILLATAAIAMEINAQPLCIAVQFCTLVTAKVPVMGLLFAPQLP